jgi:hypothetical protein
MTELLILLLVAAAYALGKARDERDRMLLILAERRAAACRVRDHWQPIEDQLGAERQVWRATAAVHEAARCAMQDIVADVPQPPPAHVAARQPPARRSPLSRQGAATTSLGLSAEEVQRLARRGTS